MSEQPPVGGLKPYFVRAVYEWCVDSGLTPYLAVLSGGQSVLPPDSKDTVVLNLSQSAVRDLSWDDDCITFTARFGGVARDISAEMDDVVAIYAHETGEGVSFPESELPESQDMPQEQRDSAPKLRLV